MGKAARRRAEALNWEHYRQQLTRTVRQLLQKPSPVS